MKQLNISILTMTILLLVPSVCRGQYVEYEKYAEEAGEKMIVIRGKKAFTYNVRYNGHCYWETEIFKGGVLRFNGKTYTDLEMNIDACHNELLVKMTSSTIPIAVDKSAVSYLKIGDSEFVQFEEGKYPKLDPGFYEVLCEGDSYNVFRKVTKTLSPDADGHGSGMLGYRDPNFNYNIHDFFCFHQRFYLEKDGKMKKIGSGKAAKLSSKK